MRIKLAPFATLLVIVSSVGASILDQAQETIGEFGTFCDEWHWAQTFTPGMGGQLDSIDVYLSNLLYHPNPPDYPTTIAIANVIDSMPGTLILGQVYVDQFTDGFNNIDFLSESVFLTAGTTYAIVISNDDPDPYDYGSVTWDLATSDVYSGGSLWNWMNGVGWNQDYLMPDYDFSKMDAAFRTYMLPEPSALLLLALGAVILRGKCRMNTGQM